MTSDEEFELFRESWAIQYEKPRIEIRLRDNGYRHFCGLHSNGISHLGYLKDTVISEAIERLKGFIFRPKKRAVYEKVFIRRRPG